VTLFESLKLVHVSCAFTSIAGFGLRGYWMARSNPLLEYRAAKVFPHIIDTLLLGSALWMLLLLQMSPLQQPWFIAKIVALLVYIALGLVALRFGRTKKVRMGAYVLALLTAAYLISVAYSKSPLGLLQLL